jgi:anaerobic ribonucleoside-triphosphate reductase
MSEAEKEYLTCPFCGKKDETVRERECGYQREVNDEEVLEIICDECEQEHLWDI